MVRFRPFTLTAFLAVALTGTSSAGTGQPHGPPASAPGSRQAPADLVAVRIADAALRALVKEALERNPRLGAAFARARAASRNAPQAASLPDPTAEATAFLAPPETRVGPQRLMLGYSQPVPWLAKLDLREKAAVQEAVVLHHEAEADRLRLVTEVRRLYYELVFLDRSRQATETFREHLVQHEEVARARYATGVGSTQAVLKLQAEITRAEHALVGLDLDEAALRARINGLRDRPAAVAVARDALPDLIAEIPLQVERLAALARSLRPELRAGDIGLARAGTLERLARMAYRPDFRVGATYTLVTPRDDDAARLRPPAGDGNDVFGLRGAVTLPLRRRSRAAAVQQALDERSLAVDRRRAAELAIETEVGDLVQRLPLSWRRLRLLEDMLAVQAEEALASAEAGYVAGALDTLDLFDAEHVLFEAQTAVDRAKADYLIGLAELEGAVGRPLPRMLAGEKGAAER